MGPVTAPSANQVATYDDATGELLAVSGMTASAFGDVAVPGNLSISGAMSTVGAATIGGDLDVVGLVTLDLTQSWWTSDNGETLCWYDPCHFQPNDAGWSRTTVGSGASFASGTTGATADRSNIYVASTGTTATGAAALLTANSSVWFGGGTWVFHELVYIPTLSDGTQTFAARWGFLDVGNAAPVDGVYFQHDSTTGNWRICASDNSVRTETTSSSAISAGTWYRLTIVVNAAASSAEFFVDGVSIGTVTTNIPAASGRVTGVGMSLIKSAGTTARTFAVSGIGYKHVRSTPLW